MRYLALIPRDGLFCKDARGWHTSSSGRGHALDWPWPSTLLGALRSAWGREEEALLGRPMSRDEWRDRTASIALGATIALRRAPGARGARWSRVWPVPADALWLEGHSEVFRLDPRPPTVPTLGVDDDEAREALWVPTVDEAAKPLRSPRWWTEQSMRAWLAGDSVPAEDAASLKLHRRVQAHVGIRPDTLTADESVLFAHDVIETLEPDAEWAIGVEVDLPQGSALHVGALGSDRRLAHVEALPESVFAPPDRVLETFRRAPRGLRLVVVTPAQFERGWCPDGLAVDGLVIRGRVAPLDHELLLRAAIVPRPVHVSGWDMAAGQPKPTSRMVPPGAVYFFERADGEPFTEQDARRLWLAKLGARTAEGFGRVVPGTWFPTRSSA